MKLNKAGKDLIKSFEGLRLSAYKCSANKETIGFGNTFYEDGSPVKMGDTITRERADSLFELIANSFAERVRREVKTILTDNQFSALVSIAYNIGIGMVCGIASIALLQRAIPWYGSGFSFTNFVIDGGVFMLSIPQIPVMIVTTIIGLIKSLTILIK